MKKYISLETPVVLPEKAVTLAENLVAKTEKKKRKASSPRPMRAFRYRGEQFMFINQNELTLVCTINKQTKTPEPVIQVPNEKARLAMRALTKIIQAETVLDSIKHQ